YRMAYVGSVAVHDRDGNALVPRRFAATANECPSELMARVGGEGQEWLRWRPGLPLTIVQDGGPELWNLLEHWSREHRIIATVQLIDCFHVDERLAEITLVRKAHESSTSTTSTSSQPQSDPYASARKQAPIGSGVTEGAC